MVLSFGSIHVELGDILIPLKMRTLEPREFVKLAQVYTVIIYKHVNFIKLENLTTILTHLGTMSQLEILCESEKSEL
jgi:hypothetical protein